MKSLNKAISFHLLLLLFVGSSWAQIPWPTFPSTVQPDLTGTLGEFRGSISSPRFHQGTDVTNGSDYRVFAVEAGTVTNSGGSGCNKYIDIQSANGTIRYYHIDAIVFSGNVAANQQIGSMTTTGGCAVHLHIQRIGQNFLQNGFSPFVDRTLPTIYAWSARENGHSLTRSAIRYSQDVVIDGDPHRVLGNKVDLVLNADDTRLNTQGSSPGIGAVAPFQLAYQILDFNGNSIGDTIVDNIDFSQTPLNSHADKVFGVNSTSANYNWIMTSHPSIAPADRYWNTGIRQGEQEDWANNSLLDAALNLEARYPDDRYLLRFSARDVDFMSDTLPGSYNEEIMEVPIVVDNFRPYLQRVVFQQDSLTIDSSTWLWDGSSLQFDADSIAIDKQKKLEITVHSSEPLSQLTLEVPSLNVQQISTYPRPSSQGRIWDFFIEASKLRNSLNCKHEIQFTGTDYANHPLEINPANLSVRQSSSNWSPAPTPGIDQHHSFYVLENCTVGIESNAKDLGMELYPNPANNFVWVKVSSSVPLPYQIRVWNVLGQLKYHTVVKESRAFQVPLKDYAAGIYLLEVESNKRKSTKLLHVFQN